MPGMKWKKQFLAGWQSIQQFITSRKDRRKGKMKYFVECCGCDYRNGKTKGVNMGIGVENSVKSGRESDLSGLRKRYLGNFSI